MKKAVKYIAIVIVVVIVIAIAAYSKLQPVPVATITMTPHTAELNFTEQGTVTADAETDISSTVSGKVTGVPVSEGQAVRKGDVICTLDATELNYQISANDYVIQGFQAQIANLGLADQKAAADIQNSIKQLEGQLETVKSQAETSAVSTEQQLALQSQQLALQNTLIAQSEADVARSQENLNTAKQLYDSDIISQQDYNDAVANFDAKTNALEQNRRQLDVIASGQVTDSTAYYNSQRDALNAQISSLRAELNKSYSGEMKKYYESQIQQTSNNTDMLRSQLDDYTIKSTADGVITELYVKNTNAVTAQTPIAKIASYGQSVEVYVLTDDIDAIKPGDAVSLTLKRVGGDVSLTGRVTAIGDHAVSQVSALGVDERRVKVNVAPDDPSGIKLGYDVNVTFTAYRADNVITAPKTAIFKAKDKNWVWLVKNGALTMAEITEGVELSTEYVITAGLAAGDAIVSDCSADGLAEGVKVKQV